MALGQEERNPAVRLIGYYEQLYLRDSDLGGQQKSITDLQAGCGTGGIVFDTTAAQRDCPVLRTPPRMLEEGYIGKFLDCWMRQWAN